MPWSILTIALCAYVGLCAVFVLLQRSFIYYPTPPRGMDDAPLVLETASAELLVACRPHDGPRAVVYFGGNAEDVVATLPWLAATFPDRAAYALHYRGYGGSSGRPSEPALRADARAVFEFVHGRHPDVVVIGRSLGSSLAIQLAAEKPVTRLVLITPFDSILAIAQRAAPFLPMTLLLHDRYESWRYAAGVSCPTTIIVAAEDQLVPPADSERLRAAFRPGVATLLAIPEAGHNSIDGFPAFHEAVAGPR